MKCVPVPREGGTVVILGAGASYGAHVPEAPPVMVNFIREGRKRVEANYDRLWNFLGRMGYESAVLDSGAVNIEDAYSFLQILSNALWYETEKEFIEHLGEEFWKIPPVAFIESFILDVVNRPSLWVCRNTCKYHDSLVRSLNPGDTILSFNYDLICDASLCRWSTWSELGGYGFPCFELLADDEAAFDTDAPCDIALLKLHGSLNWKFSHKALQISAGESKTSIPYFSTFHERLASAKPGSAPQITVKPIKNLRDIAYEGPLAPNMADFYDTLAAGLKPKGELWKITGLEPFRRKTVIIPPTVFKLGDPEIPDDLVRVWAAARKALSLAARIVCIGYSFPAADIQFEILFRIALRNNKRKKVKVEIVDPNPTVVEKVKTLFSGTRISHVARNLQEFVGG